MARNLKENLDLLAKKLKEFKKKFKKEREKSLELAQEIQDLCSDILKEKDLEDKQKKQIEKTFDSMRFYKEHIKKSQEFIKKWEN